ncbi:MAG TPA: exodeoxyribonuclease VII small subunit [Sphingomicrobium sp.]|nr:exodeoxyribonuclease VII small subunit [Sphingomicrobium sp.]
MNAPEIETLSFEAALAELETIVRSLEAGTAPLDESIELYQRGDRLKRHCEARLKAAQARIDQISVDPEGRSTGTSSFDAG